MEIQQISLNLGYATSLPNFRIAFSRQKNILSLSPCQIAKNGWFFVFIQELL